MFAIRVLGDIGKRLFQQRPRQLDSLLVKPTQEIEGIGHNHLASETKRCEFPPVPFDLGLESTCTDRNDGFSGATRMASRDSRSTDIVLCENRYDIMRLIERPLSHFAQQWQVHRLSLRRVFRHDPVDAHDEI